MRDILNDLDATRHLSDPDPIRRAQIQMKAPLPKRFYKAATVEEGEGGFAVKLDGRSARTPARAPIALPTNEAAQLVADEFSAQEAVIDPMTMPVLRLVNTAIDGVSREADAVVEDLLRFASSDMLCYRADSPQRLVERQNEAWDGVLDWARASLGARMNLAEGVIHVEQPREAIAALGLHLRQRTEPFRLAALHLMTSISGSALLALAVEAREMDAETAWTAAHVDEDWQIDHWGQDSEAMARRSQRKRDFMAAVRLIAALDKD
jgi:chaperone required for assembly of F1-ATPase